MGFNDWSFVFGGMGDGRKEREIGPFLAVPFMRAPLCFAVWGSAL